MTRKPTLVVAASRPYETVTGIQCAAEDCPAIVELAYVASSLPSMWTDNEMMSTAIEQAATALRWSHRGDDWHCPTHREET